MRLINSYINLMRLVSMASGLISAGIIILAVMVICQMIFVRSILNESVVWQSAFVIYAIIVASFIGAPYVQREKGHINVDLAVIYANNRIKLWLFWVAYSLSLLFCAIIAYYSVKLTNEYYIEKAMTNSIWSIALWIPCSSMAIGFSVLTLQLVADMLAVLVGKTKAFEVA